MILEIENLNFKYSNKEILKDVSFKIDKEETVCLLGKNGVGKTTLLELILSLKKYKNGSISINNKLIKEYSNKELSKLISYVPQSIEDTSLTVHDFLILGRIPYFNISPSIEDESEVINILKKLNIEHLINNPLNELSGGERQLISIGRAMLSKPKLMILDEPTANLDINNKKKILDLLKSLNKNEKVIIFISIHDINEALYISDRLLMMKEGKILYDIKSKDIKEEYINNTYDVRCEIIDNSNKFINFYFKEKTNE